MSKTFEVSWVFWDCWVDGGCSLSGDLQFIVLQPVVNSNGGRVG